MEKPETTKMLISVTPDVRAWVEREAKTDDRTLSSVINRAIREKIAARQEREKTAR
jgi:hypothetical protein